MGMTFGTTSEVFSPHPCSNQGLRICSFRGEQIPSHTAQVVPPGERDSTPCRKLLLSGNPSGGPRIKCFNYAAPRILILPGVSSDAAFKAQLGLICLTSHGLHYPKCRLNFPLKGPQMHRTKDEARSQCIIFADEGETSLPVGVLILQTN